MHARKSIFHTHFGAEEEHQNKRTTYPILCDKMGRMEARTQPVAHTKTKAQPPDLFINAPGCLFVFLETDPTAQLGGQFFELSAQLSWWPKIFFLSMQALKSILKIWAGTTLTLERYRIAPQR